MRLLSLSLAHLRPMVSPWRGPKCKSDYESGTVAPGQCDVKKPLNFLHFVWFDFVVLKGRSLGYLSPSQNRTSLKFGLTLDRAADRRLQPSAQRGP